MVLHRHGLAAATMPGLTGMCPEEVSAEYVSLKFFPAGVGYGMGGRVGFEWFMIVG